MNHFVFLRNLLIQAHRVVCLLLFMMAGVAPGQVSKNGDSTKINIHKPVGGGLDKPIDYSASDSIIFHIKQNKVYLFKDAVLDYGDIHLTANYIEVNLKTKEIFAKGGLDSTGKYAFLPILKDGDDSYKADSMRYNSGSKKGRVYGLRLVQDEAVIHLTKVLKQSDGSFVGLKGKITTCDLDHPHFYFNAKKIKVVPKKKVYFGPANLVVEDVPTPLAVPFGIAPIQKGRRNGILFPSYGYNYANKSLYLSRLGYYTGLGPYADLTLTTDAYFNGDLRAGLSTNILKKYKYRGTLSLNGSRFGNGTERTSPAFTHRVDFSVVSSFGFDSKYLPGTTLNGNINVQTGNFNKLNSRDLNSIAQNQYTSSINYGRNFLKNKITLSAAAKHYQNTQTHEFRLELPTINVGIPSITPFAGNGGSKWYQQIRLSYNMNMSNVLKTTDTALFGAKGKAEFKNLQNGISHSINTGTTFKLFKGTVNLSPSASYNEQWYFKSSVKSWDYANKKEVSKDSGGFYRMQRYSFSTGISTNVYGTYQHLHVGKIRAMRHTITPTISVGYSPKIDGVKKGWIRSYSIDTSKTLKPIYRTYNLFEKAGGSAYNQLESGSIGFNINNNLQGKKVVSTDSNGKEKLEKVNLIDALNISGSYNMLADSMNFSDINTSLNTSLFKLINVNSTAQFSPYALNNNHQRYNKYQYSETKSPLRFVNFHTSVSARLSPENFKGKKKPEIKPKTDVSETELAETKKNEEKYYNFNIPWSLSLTYVIDVNKEQSLARGANNLAAHAISFSGDVTITPEWKIGISRIGYDFVQKQITSTQFTVSRNLHCWQLDFTWVPLGTSKFWLFTLRPKSGLLQDLKLNRRVYANPAMFGAY